MVVVWFLSLLPPVGASPIPSLSFSSVNQLRRRLGDSESECTALETQLAACRADTGELQAERDQLRHELATVSGTATQLRRLHQG